ncbi:STAS-like domain-containing protein [Opitutus terrae]|uniref:STAS-like domain-containing protein n=1 Tax=Opitutus terrae TaxID=107709 RepID=UPI00130525CB|nr:STAS-like domain-containing protein [Opitutus terrae]
MELRLAQEFGAHLADGEAAARFRLTRIEPYVAISPRITLDFTGVRSANSSFMNALVAGLVEQHGEAALARFVFKGCNPMVRVLVEAAIDLGLQKIEGRIDA